MINLHERLSEFSYGYGVTREVERLLSGMGLGCVPFLPSLLQEKQIGIDAGFNKPGVPILLQFKLGQSLRRFVRDDKNVPAPPLTRPFFRFSIDTSEPDGQFETLLKAETDGAEVYYLAPRFSDWPRYVQFFEAEEVLERSVMITPKAIRAALVAKSAPDGPHRIVYDTNSAHVCTTPTAIEDVRPAALAGRARARMEGERVVLRQTLHRIYAGLGERSAIRRPSPHADDLEVSVDSDSALDERVSQQTAALQRAARLERLRARARSDDDAIAAALGFEMWGLGIQVMFVFEPGAGASGA